MALAYQKRKYLFETRPDIFPQGYETAVERELWSKFFADLNKEKDG
jgi:hypothetical protein